MKIVPVLDVKDGIVVRAVGGRRADYRPLVSRLTSSTEPVAVAEAIRAHYGLTETYLADLDAIGGAEPAVEMYDRLSAQGLRLWVDAGVREMNDCVRIAGHADVIVAGLETLQGPDELATSQRSAALSLRVAAKQVGFSVDLRDGRPLGNCAAWGSADPLAIVERVLAGGIRRIILLDLARVGMGLGPGTEDLCAELIRRFAGIEFFVGGGVRGRDDLKRLEALGVAGALVASALHNHAI